MATAPAMATASATVMATAMAMATAGDAIDTRDPWNHHTLFVRNVSFIGLRVGVDWGLMTVTNELDKYKAK